MFYFNFSVCAPFDPVFFTQPDSLLPNVYDPQQLNRYMFERANPYGNVDEDGHLPHIVAAGLIGAGIGGIIGGGAYLFSHHRSGKSMSWGGFLGSVGGGAVSGGVAGAVGAAALPLLAIAGINAGAGAIDQMIVNWAEGEDIFQSNVLTTAGMSFGLSYAGGKIASKIMSGSGSNPNSHLWKLKYMPSWFTTKTGQTFMGSQFSSQMINSIGTQGIFGLQQSIQADNTKKTSSSGGGSTYMDPDWG
jgi:hypothetical protein